MKPATLSCLFALVVVVANWHSTKIYEYSTGTTKTSLDGAGLIVLFCVVALLLLSRGIYKQVRHCLDQGVRIPYQTRFIQFWPCLLLLPLLVRWSVSYADSTQDGAHLTHSYGYGSDASACALVLCVITIVIFQFYKGISQFIEKHQKVGSSHSPKPLPPSDQWPGDARR